jgi:exosortase A-associated hydrolase 2
MNKSRHVVAQAARKLAARGVGVLLIDLLGCGDSTGNLDEATWAAWREDVRLGADWLRSHGHERIVCWGMRLGAVLAVECARELGAAVERCVLWQPVLSGSTFLTQFLRLRIANEMLSQSGRGVSVASLRARLAAGETLEIAGYPLTPQLASDLEARALEASPPPCPVDWIEITPDAERGASSAALRVAEGWRSEGVDVKVSVVVGEQFWAAANAIELVQCPELVEATAAVAEDWS